MTTLHEMWQRLAQHQPYADANGYGPAWATMCEKQTAEAARVAGDAAHAAGDADDAALAAWTAWEAAAWTAGDAVKAAWAVNYIKMDERARRMNGRVE
jgi:hypothetical protein